MRKLLPLLLLSLAFQSVDAFDLIGKERRNRRDSSYISIPERHWSPRIYGVQKFFDLTFKTPTDSVPNVRYSPYKGIGAGIGIFYRSLGVWVGTRVAGEKSDGLQFDLQLNSFGQKFIGDFYLQYHNGFELLNAREHDVVSQNLRAGDYRGDMRSLNYGMTLNYMLNWKKFSARAAFIQTEKQKKSAGSILVGGSLGNLRFVADSSIIPFSENRYPEEGLRAGLYRSFAANIGYSHSFVFGNFWFTNITLGTGLGGVYWKYERDMLPGDQGISPMLRWQVRASLGFNSRVWISGLTAVLDEFNLFYSHNELRYRLGNVRLFVGYRPHF